MAWEENSRICLHMQLIAILSRIGVKGAFSDGSQLHIYTLKHRNTLSIKTIIAARSKLTNFELKISSRVQLAVLSGQKCKYSNEAQLAPVEEVMC